MAWGKKNLKIGKLWGEEGEKKKWLSGEKNQSLSHGKRGGGGGGGGHQGNKRE